MAFRLQFSLRYLLLELLMISAAMGFTKASQAWMNYLPVSRNQIGLLDVIATMLCLVVAAGFWGAAIGGVFGQMRIGGRIAAYLLLLLLSATVLSIF